jgi:hypothetical protein
VSPRVIAVRDEPDDEPLEAILLETGKTRRLIEWWGGYASGLVSDTTRPEDVLEWHGWRPFTMELPEDWEEGYLRASGGEVSFVYGRPPTRAPRRNQTPD